MQTPIQWRMVQQRLHVVVDGDAGPGTYSALLAFAAERPVDPVIRAMGTALAANATAYEMNTAERLCEFCAQISNETGGFHRFEENLNYSAQALANTFPKRYAQPPRKPPYIPNALAHQLERQPEAIANNVYARPSMGNTQPGDGWRYRGRGALQLTFRNNYRRFGKALGVDLENHPELAADPALSVRIALHFFKLGKVNQAVDQGDYVEARRITNGGSIGLAEVGRIRGRLLTLFA